MLFNANTKFTYLFRMQTSTISFKHHRFPPQIVSHAVWLYLRFNLSLREMEEMLLERGIDVSYETIRRWAIKLGAVWISKIIVL